jgi:hypothetical protein|tara:strand:- start:244 stop:636 length:393 start_codon:yes stop_codon:yes gene_type:complete
VSLCYDGSRAEINSVPVSKKVPLEYKLDPASKLGSFIEWYEITYRTTNENGRKRKGNAKKAILDYLEGLLTGVKSKEVNDFMSSIESFREDTKLPKELQSAKNTLSPDEYENFKKLFEKIKKEEESNKAE